ncbi:M12 family metallopeptidase [Bacillus sp. CFBP9009]
MIISKEYRWENGRTIKVRFLNGEKAVQEKVEKYAHEWENYANIKFEFGNFNPAEIRISFNKGYSTSHIGNGCLTVKDQNEPTMNFALLDATSSDRDFSYFVLHEFGHALGFQHEHQSPNAQIPWDRAKTYAYYAYPPRNYSKEKTNEDVLNVLNASENNYGPFDPYSIMCYQVPEEITIGDFSTVLNTTLSEMDMIFAKVFYPKTRTLIALQGHNSKYVCADSVSWTDEICLTLTRDKIGEWEKFEFIHLGHNKVALKAYNNKFIIAKKGGWAGAILTATVDNIGAWETFEIMELGNDKIALISAKGGYVTSDTYLWFRYVLMTSRLARGRPPKDWSIFTRIKL